MRTLVIVRTLKTGGMERVAIDLARAFAEEGHESHLMYFKHRPNEMTIDTTKIQLHFLDLSKASLLSPMGFISEVAARIGNLLYRKSYFYLSGWFGGRVLKKEISRLEKEYGHFDRIIFRGMGTYEQTWSYRDDRCQYVLENILHTNKVSSLDKLRAKVLLRDRHLVCVSNGVKASAQKAQDFLGFTPKSLNVITNPCFIDDIRNKMQVPNEDIPTTPYIVNVARLVPQKNQALLLDAYAKANLTEELVIVGEGRLRKVLEQQAVDLGIAAKVHFVGNQVNPYPWMKQAKLFVLSSSFEGLGVVLIEALACCTPIISVDCPGGVRDVFTGDLEQYLCEPTSEALAHKMKTVLSQGAYEVNEIHLIPFTPQKIVGKFISNH